MERIRVIQCRTYLEFSKTYLEFSKRIIKLIRQKFEIFEEMLIVKGSDASYCCLYSILDDFNCLEVEMTKERMHKIQCESYK